MFNRRKDSKEKESGGTMAAVEDEEELIVEKPNRARIRKAHDGVKMFEPVQEGPLPVETPAAHYGNVSVAYSEHTNITQAMVVHDLAGISIAQWDPKLEKIRHVSFPVKDPKGTEGDETTKPIVMQAKFVTPANRNSPLIVVCSTAGVHFYDSTGNRNMLVFIGIHSIFKENEAPSHVYGFTRGVTCVENTIFVGTHTGAIMLFNCSGSTSISFKKCIYEHKSAIADMATCKFDDLTASAEGNGQIYVWTKMCKSINKRITCDNDVTVINVLRKQVLVGSIHGQIYVYEAMTGVLRANVSAHCRPVTGISVAPESAYVLTCSEDSTVRVFKLHTRKPEQFQMEFRYGDILEDKLLVGCHFANDRGSAMVFAIFDQPSLLHYKIYKKVTA